MTMDKLSQWIQLIVILTVATLTLCKIPSMCQTCLQSRTCQPPDCFCCRDDLTHVNISLAQIPQMVFFTFDDAVTSQASVFYKQLFAQTRKNPNGCPISMTLFISHANTQYRLVSEFHSLGMEIASHSVTHSTMNGTNFIQEAKSQKENLAKLAGVPIEEITGWRSPFLKPTGDLQPDALKKLGYTYDATLTFSKRSLREKPPGPFTLDFGYPFECQVKPCPKHKHPGFWEIPVVSLMDYKQAYDCVYVDGCMNAPPDEDAAYKFLWDNFHNYYTTTRMPFGVNMHPSWFFYPDRLKAMDRFIQKLVSLNDVYIISANKMLEWLKRPAPLQDLHSFAPWACDGREKAFNSGPRIVKTNLPPPPAPRSFIQWSNSPRVVYTPAPPTNQRTFTKTRLFTPPDAITIPGQKNPLHPNLFTLDLTKEAASNANKLESLRRHRNNRWRPQTSSPAKTSRDMGSGRRITRQRRLEMLPPPIVPSITQRERLEQHEERMRQRRILEEKQRQQKLLEQRRAFQQEQEQRRQLQQRQKTLNEQRRQQKIHQEKLIEQQRHQELASQQKTGQVSRTVPKVPIRPKPEETRSKKRGVLWTPSVMSSDVSSDIISKVDSKRTWAPTELKQETVKIWPRIPPSFRVAGDRGRQNQMRSFIPGRAGTGARQRLLEKIQSPTNVGYVEVTPAPVLPRTRNTIRFTESPRHMWYTDRRARFGQFTNAPRFSRGGSNRRPGFIDPPMSLSIQERQFQRQRHIQNLQSHRLKLSNSTNNRRNDRPDSTRERLNIGQIRTENTADRLTLGQKSPSVVVNRNSRTRNRVPVRPTNIRAPQSRASFPRRTVLNPTVAQQLAWNSFIRKMLGPH